MSTLKANDITKVNGDPVLSGRVVTLTQYTSSSYAVGGAAPRVIDSFNFTKKFSSSISTVFGIFGVNNLQESSQAQRYTVYRGSSPEVGMYRLRHGNSGWSMSLDTFTWTDTGAAAGVITYNLRIEEYVSQFYYNYPTNLSGSPNGLSTFTIMEILN